MRWQTLGAAVCAAAVLLLAASPADAQAVNGANKAWQVKYHKMNGSPKSNDIGVRLKIRTGTGNRINATLTRYDKTAGGGTSEKYDKRNGFAGEVELTGVLTSPNGGNPRKREDFVLAGVYFDNTGSPRVVTIRGYHHAGKSKSDRADDNLCVRIGDKALAAYSPFAVGAGGVMPAPAPGEPCDEQPPDEDVLCEDDVTDPTATTPSPDPPYDGGA